MTVTTARRPQWVDEFGEEYDVPREITMVEAIEDVSWHNNVCPSFAAQVVPGDDQTTVEIWVDHPDPDRRERGWRYAVSLTAWEPEDARRLHAAGLAESTHGFNHWEGDDPLEAVRQMIGLLVEARRELR